MTCAPSVPGHVKAPAEINVETPSFQTVETASSGVSASCWVHTGFEATVSWRMDGKETQSGSVRQSKNSSHIVSELTLPQSQWKTLGRVSCKVEHVCLESSEKTVPVAGESCSLNTQSTRLHELMCDMTLSSSSSVSSSGVHQEVSSRPADRRRCCAGVCHLQPGLV